MKQILLSILFFPVLFAGAQNVGIGTNTPDASALLHLNSTTKGILIPSMTGTQRLALANPAEGLLIYDLSQKKTFQYQDGAWRVLITSDYWAHSGTRNWVYNGTDSIGMGTAAPQDRLHINNGNIRLSGDMKVGGSVGVGTNTPEDLLHVRGTTLGQGVVVESANPSIVLGQTNYPNAGYTHKGYFRLEQNDVKIGTTPGNSAGKFVIQMNGFDRAAFDNSGNLNIGGRLTSTPTGAAPLTPICYGRTNSVSGGGIASGTSNVTVTRVGLGQYRVVCASFSTSTVFIATGIATDVNVGSYYNNDGSFTVRTRTVDGSDVDQIFNFVAF